MCLHVSACIYPSQISWHRSCSLAVDYSTSPLNLYLGILDQSISVSEYWIFPSGDTQYPHHLIGQYFEYLKFLNISKYSMQILNLLHTVILNILTIWDWIYWLANVSNISSLKVFQIFHANIESSLSVDTQSLIWDSTYQYWTFEHWNIEHQIFQNWILNPHNPATLNLPIWDSTSYQ